MNITGNPLYEIGDRVQFEPDIVNNLYPLSPGKGTIIGIRQITRTHWQYRIQFDKNVIGLEGWYSESYLSTTTEQKRENKLRRLGI